MAASFFHHWQGRERRTGERGNRQSVDREGQAPSIWKKDARPWYTSLVGHILALCMSFSLNGPWYMRLEPCIEAGHRVHASPEAL